MNFTSGLPLRFLPFIFLLPFPLYGADTWPEQFLPFLEAHTSPLEEWSPDLGPEPTKQDQSLLEKFKPRIFISSPGVGPVDFYETYLPRTRLKGPGRKNDFSPVTREILKEHERKFGFSLDYIGPEDFCQGADCQNKTPPLYGRVIPDTLKRAEGPDLPILVLKYTAVFPISGLPAKMAWWKTAGTGIIGNLKDWHELDIHGAIQLILDARTQTPIILLLAQHNHFSTYVIKEDIPLWEEGGNQICFAERSNEPYPCHTGTETKFYPTVATPEKFEFVLTGKNPPLASGWDKVESPQGDSVLLDTCLVFLPKWDPLYTSWISLGEERKIFGIFNSFSKQGPPGINLNTWPVLSSYGDIAKFWYFKEGDEEGAKILEDSFDGFFNLEPEQLLKRNGGRLWKRLKEAGQLN